MSEEAMPHSVVKLMLTKHISSACRMCGRRNEANEGFIEVTLSIEALDDNEKPDTKMAQGHFVSGYHHGFAMYCTDCYEMLRKAAVEDCKEFVPFYELVYEEHVNINFPPELIVSCHDAFQLWRRKVDKEAWLAKLESSRSEDGQ